MATVTRTIDQSTAADGGLVTFQYDYDDVTLAITVIRCINQSSKPVVGRATLISDPTRTYSKTFAANATDTIAIPTNQANRLQLFVNANGKLDGVDWSFGGTA